MEISQEAYQDYMSMRKHHPAVLCHGDPRMHNTIINEQTGEYFYIIVEAKLNVQPRSGEH